MLPRNSPEKVPSMRWGTTLETSERYAGRSMPIPLPKTIQASANPGKLLACRKAM